MQNTERDGFLKNHGYQKQRKGFKEKSRSLEDETELNKPAAFFTQEPADDANVHWKSSRNTSVLKETRPGITFFIKNNFLHEVLKSPIGRLKFARQPITSVVVVNRCRNILY